MIEVASYFYMVIMYIYKYTLYDFLKSTVTTTCNNKEKISHALLQIIRGFNMETYMVKNKNGDEWVYRTFI